MCGWMRQAAMAVGQFTAVLLTSSLSGRGDGYLLCLKSCCQLFSGVSIGVAQQLQSAVTTW